MLLRYHRELARRLGLTEETLALAPAVTTVAQLAIHLAQRGETWREVLTPAAAAIVINDKDAGWCDRLQNEDVLDLSLKTGQGD